LNSTGRDNVAMMGRPWRAGPVKSRRGPPLDELTVPGGRGPGVSESSAADWLAMRASQVRSRHRRRTRMANPSLPWTLQTVRAIRTASSPANPTPRAQRRASDLPDPKRGSSDRWRPSQQARDHPSPNHRKLNLRTLALPSPSPRIPTLSTWRQGEEVRSPPARATPIPPSPPPIQRSQVRVAPTRASRSHPHRTPRWTLLLRHHPWRRLRSSAGR
jgi:hypothetical protein